MAASSPAKRDAPDTSNAFVNYLITTRQSPQKASPTWRAMSPDERQRFQVARRPAAAPPPPAAEPLPAIPS
eukprot:7725482-Pyramimonas_sp.AAC.2